VSNKGQETATTPPTTIWSKQNSNDTANDPLVQTKQQQRHRQRPSGKNKTATTLPKTIWCKRVCIERTRDTTSLEQTRDVVTLHHLVVLPP